VNKLTNYRIRQYGHILRNNKEETPEEGFEHENRRKMPNRRLRSRWEKQDTKDVKRHGRKLSSEKRETGRYTWLLDHM
jgi:hypothetical protein